MTDITRLPADWRRKAEILPDADKQLILRGCADELELAYHQGFHDAEFYSGCRFCDWEQEHQESYPELRSAGMSQGTLTACTFAMIATSYTGRGLPGFPVRR